MAEAAVARLVDQAGDRLARLLEQLAGDDATWLAQTCIRPGHAAHWRRTIRDKAIRSAARTCWPHQSATAQSVSLSIALRRYQATGWRRGTVPTQTVARALHKILELNDGQPLRARQLWSILTAPQ
jgi:hypothetical protein